LAGFGAAERAVANTVIVNPAFVVRVAVLAPSQRTANRRTGRTVISVYTGVTFDSCLALAVAIAVGGVGTTIGVAGAGVIDRSILALTRF